MSAAKLLSGFGQFHSDEVTAKIRKPYSSITWQEVCGMVDHPQTVPKGESQWLIPSSLPSRVFKIQELKGVFWALWVDCDYKTGEPKSLDEIVKILQAAIGVRFDFEIYTSKSATLEKPKCRILVPLSKPLSGSNWMIYQAILNDCFEKAGIAPDRASERCAQLCYLPNRGAFYDHRSQRNGLYFDPTQDFDWLTLHDEKQAEIAAQEAVLAAAAEAAAVRRARPASGVTAIGAFNRAYAVQQILLQAGYCQRGNSFRHPDSESGSFSASVKDGRVHSLSPSDPLFSNGRGAHDAFSSFTILFCGGDRDSALREAGAQWLTIDGESWNTVKRREYMQSKAVGSDSGDFVDLLDVPVTPSKAEPAEFTMDGFALNGTSAAMQASMLADCFVLGRLALLGQITYIYAPPNSGKTLLTIWMLIDAIKRNEIKAGDVYYVNADDGHKGLTFKTELAEHWGFKMLAPGYNNFKPALLEQYIAQMIKSNTARGKVIILDTIKKFADLMDKRKGTKFGETVRQFAMHGGTVVGLAHCNKHRDVDGQVIFAGTADLVDDCDCAYTVDIVLADKDTGICSVKFKNKKNRGDVALEAVYEYCFAAEASYQVKLDSVKSLSDEESNSATQAASLEARHATNFEAIRAIEDTIRAGHNKKTELIKLAIGCSGLSKSKIAKALREHEGTDFTLYQYWSVTKGEDNANIYELNIKI